MNRIDCLHVALKRSLELCCQYPEDYAARSITKQLEYLVELESGTRSDFERLDDIIIGILTLREIEPLDINAAELFYKVVEEVEIMKQERKTSR